MTDQELLALAESCGFDHRGMMNVSRLYFDPAVREMCAADRCRNFGRSWACPPACGTLEEISEKAKQYRRGILLQSTGQMEDDFDLDTMEETEKLQKKRFFDFVRCIREHYPDCLPMASGGCRLCESCTYPDSPCRHPGLAIPSMEAYGLMVSQVCKDSGVGYYYGPRTITYTACVLIE